MVRYFASGANTSLTPTPSPRREEGVEMGGREERREEKKDRGRRRKKRKERGGEETYPS